MLRLGYAAGVRRISNLVMLVGALLVSNLRAQGIPKGTFISSGLATGYRLQLDQGNSDGFVLGAEVSMVELEDSLLWYGGYLDGLHDFGGDSTRVSLGPEVGYGPVGMDAGYLMDLSGDGVRHGVSLRPMLTLGVFTPYARFGFLDSGSERNFAEFGVLVKFPASFNN